MNKADFSKRNVWLTAIALGLFTFLSRLPFQTQMLYAWDSGQYAGALFDFDIPSHRPQPPGYIFYIGLAKGLYLLLGEANKSLVMLSMLGAALAVSATFVLGRRMLGAGWAAAAALLLALSPNFWRYSEVAYPYTVLAALSTLMALILWKAYRKPFRGDLLWATLALSLAAGVRQDLWIYFLPLFAFVFWRRSAGAFAKAGVVALMGTAAWLIPSGMATGGLYIYFDHLREQTRVIHAAYALTGAGESAVWRNAVLSRDSLIRTFYPIFFFAPYPFLRALYSRRIELGGPLAFLALWAGVPLLFYVFFHIGDYGYVLSVAPALALLISYGLKLFTQDLGRLLARLGKRPALRFTALLGALVVAGAAGYQSWVFLASDKLVGVKELRRTDENFAALVLWLRENPVPPGTAVLAPLNQRQLRYYLPQTEFWAFDQLGGSPNARTVHRGDVANTVITLHDLRPAPGIPSQTIELPGAPPLYRISVKPGDRLVADWRTKQLFIEPPRE